MSERDPAVDRVLEERYANRRTIKVQRVSRNGYTEREERIKVYRKRTTNHRGLGGEITERTHWSKVADVRANDAIDIAEGICELLGYEVDAR